MLQLWEPQLLALLEQHLSWELLTCLVPMAKRVEYGRGRNGDISRLVFTAIIESRADPKNIECSTAAFSALQPCRSQFMKGSLYKYARAPAPDVSSATSKTVRELQRGGEASRCFTTRTIRTLNSIDSSVS